MEKFLAQMMGKKIDVSCGSSHLVRGDVMAVKEGILYLRDDEERVAYVAIDKVAAIWEVENHEIRPGFVFGKKPENSKEIKSR